MEEQRSTYLANTLSIVCPILFLLILFLQFKIFLLYHKYGHPWSIILNEQCDDDDLIEIKENTDDIIEIKENTDDVIEIKENTDDVIEMKEVKKNAEDIA